MYDQPLGAGGEGGMVKIGVSGRGMNHPEPRNQLSRCQETSVSRPAVIPNDISIQIGWAACAPA